MRVSN